MHGTTAAAEVLLAGIEARDYDRLATCFSRDAVLRALTPHRLRELRGADAIARQYRFWLEPLEPFELLAGDTAQIADRVRIRYHIRGCDPERGWQENEHTAYAALGDDGLIVALNLSCAGFRPAAQEPPS